MEKGQFTVVVQTGKGMNRSRAYKCIKMAALVQETPCFVFVINCFFPPPPSIVTFFLMEATQI